MSTENTEPVRRYCAALGAGAEELHAAVGEFFDPDADPDADYYPVRKFPEARPCHGQHDVTSFLTEYLAAFSLYEWQIRDLIAVGDDRVLACTAIRAEGRGSGIPLEGELHQCYWLRHGRFFRVEDHLTLRGALHALGLQGETLEEAGL